VKGGTRRRRTDDRDLAPGKPGLLRPVQIPVPGSGAVAGAVLVLPAGRVDRHYVDAGRPDLFAKAPSSQLEHEADGEALAKPGEKLRARHATVHAGNFRENEARTELGHESIHGEENGKPEPGGVERAQRFQTIDDEAPVPVAGERDRARRSGEGKSKVGQKDGRVGKLPDETQARGAGPADEQHRTLSGEDSVDDVRREAHRRSMG
jgi:hypothetical protein